MKNRAINALIEMGMPADIKGFQYMWMQCACLKKKSGEMERQRYSITKSEK